MPDFILSDDFRTKLCSKHNSMLGLITLAATIAISSSSLNGTQVFFVLQLDMIIIIQFFAFLMLVEMKQPSLQPSHGRKVSSN